MLTPAITASRISLPSVIILKAVATQVRPVFGSLERFPLLDETTTGFTVRFMICGPAPNALADANAPIPAPAATKSRRLNFCVMDSFSRLRLDANTIGGEACCQ